MKVTNVANEPKIMKKKKKKTAQGQAQDEKTTLNQPLNESREIKQSRKPNALKSRENQMTSYLKADNTIIASSSKKSVK